jgi:membrane protease YdiL (CAAX protease family)
LKSDWLWILLGIVALNGIAEETLFRGYVFGHLRQEWSFHKAALISLVVFAAAHLFLFVQNSPAVAIAGTLVAVASAYPLAWLYERCHFTIWAGVIIHIMTHAIRLVDVPESFYMPAVLAWIVLQIGIPLLIFLFRGNLLKTQPVNQPSFSTLDG